MRALLARGMQAQQRVNFMRASALAGLFILAAAGSAHAATAGNTVEGGASEFILILQVVLLVLIGRIFGEVMFRLGQPTIIGQLLGGILLGPTLVGSLWPDLQHMVFPANPEQNALLEGISRFGILFLLMLAGMETDLGLALRLKKVALTVSGSGIALPFAAGFVTGLLMPSQYLPDQANRLVTALFLGTALSISSLKIVATVVREMHFMRRNIGQLIIASAIIDDTIGWVIIGISFSLVQSGTIDPAGVAISVGGTLLFLGLSLTIGQRIVFEVIRWTNDNLRSDLPVVTAIVGIMGIMALATSALGVQPVLGAFVAGMLVGRSPILTRTIDEQLRGLTTALFMPVFFGLAGLHTDLRVLANPETLILTLVVILIASLGKLGGAFLAARFNGLAWSESLALGLGMNARGSTEVIVATIGLAVGVLDQRLYSVIVTMAIVTTLAMPPTLRWALARLPMRHEEKDRLDREEFEKTSYVGGLERVLVAADSSATGKLATRLAGAFAGARAMPVSVLELDGEPPVQDGDARSESAGKGGSKRKSRSSAKTGTTKSARAAPAEAISERVKATAESAASAASEDEGAEASVHINPLEPQDDHLALLADQSGKGHDLLFVGLAPAAEDEPRFDARVADMVKAFERTSALVAARGQLNRDPDATIRILVPVNGDVWTMRGLEFACVLAKALDARVAALAIRQSGRGASRNRMSEAEATEAIFESVRRVGDHYGVNVRLLSEESRHAELAVLAVARRGRYNLIALGVNRVASEDLAFGPVADALQDAADRSLMYVIAR